VVGYEQPASVEVLHAEVEHLSGHILRRERVEQVDEAHIELGVRLLETADGVLFQHERLLAQTCLGEVGSGAQRPFVIALEGCQHAAGRCAQQPDSAVADGGAELEDSLRACYANDQAEERALVGVDDGDALAMCLLLHAREHRISRRKEAVQVFLKLVGHLNGVHAKKPNSIGWSVVMYSSSR